MLGGVNEAFSEFSADEAVNGRKENDETTSSGHRSARNSTSGDLKLAPLTKRKSTGLGDGKMLGEDADWVPTGSGFKCSYCDKKWESRASWEHHEKIHVRRTKAKEARLAKEEEEYLPPAPKRYICYVCKQKVPNANSLENHIRIHTGEKPFECDECSHSFRTRESLKSHHKHHENGELLCERCDTMRWFDSPTALAYHSLGKHDGGYPCEECGKRFKQPYKLEDHRSVHTGWKPYACPVCGMAFRKKYFIKSHMLKHSDEKKFRCDTCGRMYKHRNGVGWHRKLTGCGQQKSEAQVGVSN